MLVSDIIELKYRVDAPAMKSDSSTEKDDTTLIKFKLKFVYATLSYKMLFKLFYFGFRF
jgi:hypothetical protein